VEDLYGRGIRISVSNLDLGFLGVLGPMKEKGMDFFKGLVSSLYYYKCACVCVCVYLHIFKA